MTTGRISPPPTAPPTVAHDSTGCTAGPNGARCFMCQFAYEVEQGQSAVPERIWLTLPWYHPLRDSLRTVHETVPVGANVEYRLVGVRSMGTTVENSARTIRARRAALLERADTESPTEGAMALADAYLQVEEWFQQLPNNAIQDAAVLELAGKIEAIIGEYLNQQES